ncbi:hypothetical protein NGM10_15995 (plasmid) [Halorussus salilacus]|uniref:hypothetical protein n=1 Tax=Halorussus salilacus TaxID=2953750 RepID=UPI0020A17608|nr:hypothetical protein [Halorussus salilacus]USZ69906.1 hypothetical protein NGM10_15995 [Halorussus salilacus]
MSFVCRTPGGRAGAREAESRSVAAVRGRRVRLLRARGSPVQGAILGLLVVAAGYWEYRRKLQDEMTAERYEAEADEERRRGRE